MGIHGVTRGLPRVTRGYKGLQGVTGAYKALQGVTGDDKGLDRLQGIIETFFKVERSKILLLGLFCIRVKVEEISNF